MKVLVSVLASLVTFGVSHGSKDVALPNSCKRILNEDLIAWIECNETGEDGGEDCVDALAGFFDDCFKCVCHLQNDFLGYSNDCSVMDTAHPTEEVRRLVEVIDYAQEKCFGSISGNVDPDDCKEALEIVRKENIAVICEYNEYFYWLPHTDVTDRPIDCEKMMQHYFGIGANKY